MIDVVLQVAPVAREVLLLTTGAVIPGPRLLEDP